MPGFRVVGRRRQAEFRTGSSTISQDGRSPQDHKGQRNGHLLAHGYEEENLYPKLRGENGARKFFSDRGISWHRTSRSGDTPGEKGPTRNLASSQVACVNFLLPLCEIPGALVAVVRAMDDDVTDVVPIHHEGRVSPVEFEWIGLGHPLEEGAVPTRGSNTTSVDAFLVASTNTGRRAYLLEWKYVEKYDASDYKGEGTQGETRRCRYAHLYAHGSSSFDGSVPMEEFLYEPFYQIMRLRLLADRMVRENELGVSDAKVIVVAPQDNTAYRERITSKPFVQRFPEHETVEAVVKATSKQPSAFATIDSSALVDAVERQCGGESSDWVAYQRERYGPR